MSSNEEKPLSLATLRTKRPRARSTLRPQDLQPSLLFAEATPTPAPRKARPTPETPQIWTVRALVADVRNTIESAYTDLWIEGEISNCRQAPSGHIYFTLKDGEAQLPVVLFRRQAMLLRFRPQDGLAVLVRGRISIYESRGQLQLIAETMEPRGAGALQLAFDQLKARLLAEGLFDDSRKRALPPFPRCVGIITSPTGAVIRDIVTVIRRRHARLNLLVYPASMQGTNCPPSVVQGIRFFNAHPGKVDLIVIARGGGSIEDLSGFNDETLARTIAASTLPIVSAIGHETDFTIADFVSDLRAPTPSAAAELITAAQHRIEERVNALESRVHRAVRFHLLHARQRLTRLSADAILLRLRDAVSRRDQHLDELRLRLDSAIARRTRRPQQRLEALTARLRPHDPTLRLANAKHRLQAANQRLRQLALQTTRPKQARVARAAARLEALSPLAVLNRGYALVYSAQGTLLRSSADTATTETIHVRLAQGAVAAEVKTIDPPLPKLKNGKTRELKN
jgi:exodeoxyribonuclease VII large subunit